jgi:hypothetical protein
VEKFRGGIVKFEVIKEELDSLANEMGVLR